MKVMTTISGIDAAPSEVTMTGAMPVTRIVPARPTTNAPHQFVSCASPPPSYSSTSWCAEAPSCSCMSRPLSSFCNGLRRKLVASATSGYVRSRQSAATGYVLIGHGCAMMRRVDAFLDDLAARTPAPGGGAAAGVTCALAAALVGMAARFAGDDGTAARADALRGEAVELAEADLAAFGPVLEAMRSGPPERVAAAQAAAADVPLAIAETAAAVAGLAVAMAESGKPALLGDALAGADLAAAAARAAARLVAINLTGAPEDPRLARAEAAARTAAAH